MKPVAIACSLAALAAWTLGTVPARADLYSLDGRFQCLERGEAVCGDARRLPPAAKHVEARSPAIAAVEPPAPPESAPARRGHARTTQRAADPLHVVALRVKARRLASGDLAWLKSNARRGDPRAIELLAWCLLNGIGTPPNPVEAYLLYGAAASAGLPHARDNQAAIYERYLTSDQQQEVLDLANEGVALAQLE